MIPQIVLAPLAGGPSTPELASAVSNAGGLGFVAGGYLAPAALDVAIRRTRTLTDGPIGVNLFQLRDEQVDPDALASYAAELEPEARRRGVELGSPRFDDDGLAEKLAIVEAAHVDVVSFTFGCPAPELVARLRSSGAQVWITVASRADALAAAGAGADAVVAQGHEAGGHRGGSRDEPGTPLDELLASVLDVEVPIVASGGIAGRADVERVLTAGAAAAQVGTAFLLADEAGTSDPHRRALQQPGATGSTRSFTGRSARGIVNGFMRAHPVAPAAYPHVHHLTAPLRAAARAAGDADGINLWAGTQFARARALPARQIVASLRA